MREQLPALAAGELDGVSAHAVRAHLDACPACRSQFEACAAIESALSAPRAQVSAGDLYPAFAARLAEARSSRRRVQAAWRWAGSAACLLVLGAAWAVLRPSVPRETAPAAGAPIVAPIVGASLPVGAPHGAPTPPAKSVPEVAADSSLRAEPDVRPEPPRRRRVSSAASRLHPAQPASFLDVADSRGATARMLMRAAAGGTRGGIHVVPSVDERVAEVRGVTHVRSEAGYDASGRLSVIRIHAEPGDGSPDTAKGQIR